MEHTSDTHALCAQTRITGDQNDLTNRVLTQQAIDFLAELHLRFERERKGLLTDRKQHREQIESGIPLDFPSETKHIRDQDWTIEPIPSPLQNRRVEITGPVERKMVINALNSGASTFMADFEDSNTPSWTNLIQGQQNLYEAVQGTIALKTDAKEYKLNETTATLIVRPRGWHMQEKHFLVNDQPISASLFDFGLFIFHNAETLIAKGHGPYFYLPKTESYKEARLWNSVFDFAETYLELPKHVIKATVLIETINAVFQLDEILYELRTHAAGLNCGRWDYIFSFIKNFKSAPGYVFPDRSQITMTVPFMRSYTQLVVQTCHKRNALAIGGMAAQIPIKGDDEANNAAMAKVSADKLREVKDGHDGTWVAHPGLVPIAREIFDEHMPTPNQVNNKRLDFSTTAPDLIELPTGTITEQGLRTNINVGILYIESWLRGNGAAAIYHLMEDAATAEISRTQVWQWLHSNARLEDGRLIDRLLYEKVKQEEIEKIKIVLGDEAIDNGKLWRAVELFDSLVLNPVFAEFFTLEAYNDIN